MLKSVLAASLFIVGGMSGSQALATDSADFQRTYYMSWRYQDTGQRTGDWFRTNRPTCIHTNNCACGGENYCGEFGVGQSTYYFDQGCYNPPRVIYCDQR